LAGRDTADVFCIPEKEKGSAPPPPLNSELFPRTKNPRKVIKFESITSSTKETSQNLANYNVGSFGDLGDPGVPTLRGARGVTVYAYYNMKRCFLQSLALPRASQNPVQKTRNDCSHQANEGPTRATQKCAPPKPPIPTHQPTHLFWAIWPVAKDQSQAVRFGHEMPQYLSLSPPLCVCVCLSVCLSVCHLQHILHIWCASSVNTRTPLLVCVCVCTHFVLDLPFPLLLSLVPFPLSPCCLLCFSRCPRQFVFCWLLGPTLDFKMGQNATGRVLPDFPSKWGWGGSATTSWRWVPCGFFSRILRI